MRILVTSGATREPIDDVRFISNISTGKTGGSIANFFKGRGHDVLNLRGQGSATADVPSIEFSDFKSLDKTLNQILGEDKFNVVFHLAAVSDYSVAQPKDGKIESDRESFQLNLNRNFKILNRLKSYSSSRLLVVGFKLTSSEARVDWITAVKKIYSGGGVDFVVHNDLKDIKAKSIHRFRIFDPSFNVTECENTEALSLELEKLLRSHL